MKRSNQFSPTQHQPLTTSKKKFKQGDNFYIDNKQLLKLIIEHKKSLRDAERKKLVKPQIPDELARMILLMVENMGRRFNFKNYTFLQDMQANAVLTCVKFIDNFDPAFSSNPFGFFSMVIFRGFINTIKSEKKQFSLRFAAISKAIESRCFQHELPNPQRNFSDLMKTQTLSDRDKKKFSLDIVDSDGQKTTETVSQDDGLEKFM